METINERKNPLFGRKEVQIKITDREFPAKKDEAAKLIAEKFSVPEENVHIEKIDGKFGTRSFTILAEIYDSKEQKESINTINKKKKKSSKA